MLRRQTWGGAVLIVWSMERREGRDTRGRTSTLRLTFEGRERWSFVQRFQRELRRAGWLSQG